MNDKYRITKIIGDIGQWLAVILCSVGIVIIALRAGFNGNAFIVAGSLFFAIFTKIKYYRREK